MRLIPRAAIAGPLLLALAGQAALADTTYTYDELNRLTKVVYDDGRSISYTYDAAGNLLRTVRVGGAPTLGRLTDTGITASQCYRAGSSTLVSCASAGAIALNNQQDGMVGRDADPAANGNSDGKLGFSYSEVPGYARTECVKDNVTGLMWEGKTADGGLRDRNKTYTNYGDGRAGDSSAYVVAVNALGLCGYTDWRVPTAEELQSLVDYGLAIPGPTVDLGWFENTTSSPYWSSSLFAGGSSNMWWVYFANGGTHNDSAGVSLQLRLVRAS